jgi:two-component system, chemotaxis family, chemotaxis protein CheY
VKKILIVDDSPSMRMVLRYILEKEQNQTQKQKQKQKQKQDEESYKFFEAGSEEEALMKFEEESPDLVLLDIIMPGGDEMGIRILRKIRAINPKQAVIMISAIGQDQTIAECAKLGAIDFIVKPFDDLEVLAVVERSLA